MKRAMTASEQTSRTRLGWQAWAGWFSLGLTRAGTSCAGMGMSCRQDPSQGPGRAERPIRWGEQQPVELMNEVAMPRHVRPRECATTCTSCRGSGAAAGVARGPHIQGHRSAVTPRCPLTYKPTRRARVRFDQWWDVDSAHAGLPFVHRPSANRYLPRGPGAPLVLFSAHVWINPRLAQPT